MFKYYKGHFISDLNLPSAEVPARECDSEAFDRINIVMIKH